MSSVSASADNDLAIATEQFSIAYKEVLMARNSLFWKKYNVQPEVKEDSLGELYLDAVKTTHLETGEVTETKIDRVVFSRENKDLVVVETEESESVITPEAAPKSVITPKAVSASPSP